MVIKLLR